MPRYARVVAVGFPHHITQRGNCRKQIFFSDRDRRVYLELLARYAARYGLRVWGYCLMSNHVHVIAVPTAPWSLARAFGRAHGDYSRYRNVIRSESGHFWEARFYSCPLEGVYQWQALAYVERNPVRAGMVGGAEIFSWSSASAHCSGCDPTGLLDLEPWRAEYNQIRWRQVLSTSVDEEAWAERLREASRRGLPLGGPGFTAAMEEQTSRCLQFRGPGRPAQGLAAPAC